MNKRKTSILETHCHLLNRHALPVNIFFRLTAIFYVWNCVLLCTHTYNWNAYMIKLYGGTLSISVSLHEMESVTSLKS